MKKVRKNYSLEFKIGAVSLSEQRGNISSVAQELGICKESLVNWRKLHREGRLIKEKQILSDPIKEELLRLRKELEEAKLERDILKKAVGIFSKRDGEDINLSKNTLECFLPRRCAKYYKVWKPSYYPRTRSKRNESLTSFDGYRN